MEKCPYCDGEFKNTKALGSHIHYAHKEAREAGKAPSKRKFPIMNNRIRCHCNKCEHEWEEVFPLPMTLTSFASRLRATLCPQCNSSKVAIGPLFVDHKEKKGSE